MTVTTTPFAARRQRLLESMGPKTAAVFVATPTAIRNNDVEHDFRQDSDVFYLTGFDEPDTVVVLTPAATIKDPAADPKDKEPKQLSPKLTMFVRPKDPEREIWDGFRHGVEGAKNEFGADVAFTIDELSRRLPELLAAHDAVVYRWGNKAFDERLFSAIALARRTAGRNGAAAPTRILDPIEVLYEHRLRKSPEELAAMRRACAITAEAHKRAMSIAAPGRHEFELEAVMLETFRKHGSERPAYGSIVGSGPNATVLHYRRNDRQLQDGDLVLIDAGCEYGYYASDVTRTFPANGRFSDVQRAIYELVLEAQLAAIEMVKPGVTQGDIHQRACAVLTAGLVQLGVLEGDVDELLKKEAYKPFYMHKTGHWLGMDVHDVGAYFVPTADGKMAQRPLEPGMVITIEPGLYFGIGAEKAPERFRGIGVRIEDDILVTDSGHENLTSSIPKTVEEVERACAE
ncbi:MAG: aminopeptidase P N-terminal domain-containing protein [Deltaproteobacteria bacterium]|nr:aminopeptidase P N-terminal domain-containing protein [Deltaproteobacteria bacterium]